MKPPTDPRKVLEGLVEHFDRSLPTLKSANYNETQARREFIDPFFKLLGWDVDNEQGFAEAYKDVIHEDAIKIGSFTKAPDYCFRIGGTRKFFVEAKKPAVNIKEDVSPAYQLRRYAWSAKLPLSILTDFEEFAVYDCRVKPEKTDKASTARLHIFSFRDYLDKWEELYGLFSKEAVLKGSFDKFAESKKGKRGTAEVDDAFLQDIEAWRELLAHNLALRNPELSHLDLNSAVQRTIDRIIFLRIAEDRGLESYGRLQALLNGSEVFPRLRELFREADERYNSGLFHFKAEKGQAEPPDLLTTRLQLDDKPLKEILAKLYYPESPYEFSVLPAEILGQVYEQFLGKVIRLTAGHRAVVEDKPEVKKAGGVYYTPKYIVDYIVKNTVGKMVEGKRPAQVSGAGKNGHPLRVLDPACGSGSFLLGAYQYLLDWYRDRYTEESPEKHAKGKEPVLYQGPGGAWRLTTSERKRILLAHINGVDIDPQAVEVTKLSLLLKVLEGETAESLSRQTRVLPFQERALPDLAGNIKCGNSLISSDFYQGKKSALFDQEEMARVNAFDWEVEFPEVFRGREKPVGAQHAAPGKKICKAFSTEDTHGKASHREEERTGGFDVVIGNPPYGMVDEETSKEYFNCKYKSAEGRLDSFELFIERGYGLSRRDGLLSYIVPSNLLTNLYSRKLRRFLAANCLVKEIDNFGFDVFSVPTVHTCVIVLGCQWHDGTDVLVRKQIPTPAGLSAPFDFSLPQGNLLSGANDTVDIFVDPTAQIVLAKLRSTGTPFGDMFFIRQCIKTGNDAELVRSSATPIGHPWVASLRGKSVGRYETRDITLYLKYGPWLARNWKNRDFYERPKIAVRETGNRITATLDEDHRYFLSSLYAIYARNPQDRHSLRYALGLLNSRLATYFIKVVAYDLTKGAFTKIRTNQLARLPYRKIDFGVSHDAKCHDQMVSLVNRMLDLHKRLSLAKTNHERTLIERQIAATDKEIDRLVYDLYGLTEDEIAIVEGSSSS